MKKLLFVLFSLFSLPVLAQDIHFNAELIKSQNNVANFLQQNWQAYTFNGKKYAIIQFEKSTSLSERKMITAQTGIQFFDYIPRFAFIASIPDGLNNLNGYGIKMVVPYKANLKIADELSQRPLPEWIILGNDMIALDVRIQNDVYKAIAEIEFNKLGMQIKEWQEDNLAIVILNQNQIELLADKAFVKYIQATTAPGVPENDQGRTNHRMNVIDADYLSGKHYIGTGIAVAMGDDGTVGPHIDYRGRLIQFTTSNGGTHGDHVLGIVGGAGNQNPVAKGNGYGADLLTHNGYGNLNNATANYALYGVRITTNSLGQSCNAGYNNNAVTQDNLINSNYSLISVHSAGNSGTSNCGGVSGYKQITGGYKAAKNCFAVGNLLKDDALAPSSSRGPAKDGRIKPDICAVGTNVNSTQPNDSYASFTGTSMACPGMAGTLAALWQAYKDNNLGNDPYSAIMKGIVLNTADDLGNPGPDFQFGWGRINARRAVEVIENNQFILDTIDNGQTDSTFITVPAGVAQVRFMIYWHDPAGASNATFPLVNDLNLTATAPNTFVFKPWVLNYTPTVANLSAVAVRNVDSVNNVEQVTVKNPQPGNWKIKINGYDIPSGPQPYVIVYYFEKNEMVLTYPQGGEHFVAGVNERIRWDANDNSTDQVLEYSSDAGVNWNVISNNIPSDQRFYDWNPPATLATGEMLIRISRGTQSDVSDTFFTVYKQPINLVVDTACPNQFHLKWDAVPGATDYTLFMLGTKYMDQVATSVTNDVYLTTGVNITDTFYFSVQANIGTNNAKSRRSLAYRKLPGQINCGDDMVNIRTTIPFNNALNCSPINAMPIKMTVKNQSLTGNPISNIPVSYYVNGVLAATENIAGPLLVGDTLDYTFTALASFPGAGVYVIKTVCSYNLDGFKTNDTSQQVLTITAAVYGAIPLVQNFEGTYPPNGWLVGNPDNAIPWQKTFVFSGAVTGNTHAAYMDFYNYTAIGQHDYLRMPVLDLSTITADSVLMNFDVAYAVNADRSDRLSIQSSTDCGVNWINTSYAKGGATLATSVPSTNIFSPVFVTEWRNEQLDLSAFKGQKLMLRFDGLNDHGNNLYLDNINIVLKNVAPLGFDDYKTNAFAVYPNPSNGLYTLKVASNSNGELMYAIKNVSGQTLKRARMFISQGSTEMALDISDLSNGLYILEIINGKQSGMIKLMKQ